MKQPTKDKSITACFVAAGIAVGATIAGYATIIVISGTIALVAFAISILTRGDEPSKQDNLSNGDQI